MSPVPPRWFVASRVKKAALFARLLLEIAQRH